MAKKQKNPVLRQSFKYRSYCNKGTHRRSIRWMRDLATVWNAALDERQRTYAAFKEDPSVKPINHKFGQYHHVSRSDHPELSHINIIALQSVLAKLHDSYKSFYTVNKKDPLARPPKEKGLHRVIELGFTSRKPNQWCLEGNILTVKGLGRFKIKMHRPIEGTIKQVIITLNRGRWYVCFSCEVEPPVSPKTKKRSFVRVMFEDNAFIKDSTGREIKHPEFYFTEISRLRQLSRSLSRKTKGGKNWKKARHTLRKWHEHIANKRKYFIEEIANDYVSQFDIIEIPKLPLKENIMQATTSRKAQSLCDAAYGLFVSFLKHCAKKNGKEIVEYAL